MSCAQCFMINIPDWSFQTMIKLFDTIRHSILKDTCHCETKDLLA